MPSIRPDSYPPRSIPRLRRFQNDGKCMDAVRFQHTLRMPRREFSNFLVLLTLVTVTVCDAHEQTRLVAARALAQAEVDRNAEQVSRETGRFCKLTVQLKDGWTRQSVPGLVRVTNLDSGRHVALDGEFHRAANWYALEENATIRVPRARVRLEAVRGLKTKLATHITDLEGLDQSMASIELQDFYETKMRGIRGGNTHLHLNELTHAEADRYLRLVPRADNLDLVFLSHLRRVPDERTYITNQIVENSFAGGDLQRLSQSGVVFGNGEEHRHNFGGYGQGYGHVMLLNLKRLIRPVSIGPGIMQSGTDGRPMQKGIQAARADDATVIWCHNTFGHEDLPNWVAGLVHAQNIFDGGDHGTYADTFYRYLNLGMTVPFSTGTDWFIYDFSRVYVPVDGQLTVDKWLAGLRSGKSYITNGPFLELETERAPIGGTLRMTGPNRVTVVGRGMGRQDFQGLELVHDGEVVHTVTTQPDDGFFVADLRHGLEIDKSGWFALRIPLQAGRSELDKPLFAHTSPIYVTMAGQEVFDGPTAKQLIAEMTASIETISAEGTFADEAERESVIGVYRRGIEQLRDRIGTANAE